MGSAWGELGVLEECGEISLTRGGAGGPWSQPFVGQPPKPVDASLAMRVL